MLKDDILRTIKTIKKLNFSEVKGNKDERKLLLRALVRTETLVQLLLTIVLPYSGWGGGGGGGDQNVPLPVFLLLLLQTKENTRETGGNFFYSTSKALFILMKMKF